jgi:hypothetical protein
MALDTRELFARLIQCEAGGEGTDGMQAVATVIMNRATINYGEFSRVNNGGDIRAVITQPYQFTCLQEFVNGNGDVIECYDSKLLERIIKIIVLTASKVKSTSISVAAGKGVSVTQEIQQQVQQALAEVDDWEW